MADKEINITYDTLFELLRREKNREELQPLQETFYQDIVNYLRKKEAIMKKPDDGNVFFSDEKDKTKSQLENVRKIIKELYERRERKLVEMSMFKSRTGSSLINTANVLKEERLLFDSLVGEFNMFRNGVLNNVLSLSYPVMTRAAAVEKQSESRAASKGGQEMASERKEAMPKAEANETAIKATHVVEISKPGQANDAMLIESIKATIRFTSHVPKFVGKELEVYGPFEPEDIAHLPKAIADILVRKGRAENIESNS